MINFEKYRDEILKGCAEKKLYPSYSEGITIEEFANAVRDVFYKYSEEEYENFEQLLAWLFAEYKKPILTKQEKAYLSAVIKPFRDEVKYILKLPYDDWAEEYISIHTEESGNAILPRFEENTQFKNMVCEREYTLEELGL